MKELKIVVVDDSPLIRDYLQCAFSRIEGCNVVGMAEDGNEALTAVHSLQPHVLILDVWMPHRDGIQVLREIRKQNSEVVIIMFTADSSVLLEELCLKEGANHYLTKTQFLELIDICEELQTA